MFFLRNQQFDQYQTPFITKHIKENVKQKTLAKKKKKNVNFNYWKNEKRTSQKNKLGTLVMRLLICNYANVNYHTKLGCIVGFVDMEKYGKKAVAANLALTSN